MEKKYTVYMHKNKINGKVYVGITSREPEKRWKNGKGYKGSRYFEFAIEKYGWNNFEHIILYTNLTKEQAEQYEIELIRDFDSTNRDKGYNIQYGGRTTGTMAEESKQKISHANKGKVSWIKGKHHSEETKRKIGEANSDNNIIFQYNRNSGEFLNEFPNLKIASKSTGLRKEAISAVCYNREKSIGGYIFRYKTDDLKFGENLNMEELEKSKNRHFRPIKQYTKDGQFIRKFESIRDAELFFGKKQGSTLIWHCVNHKKPSALGYLWCYSDEEIIIPKFKNKKSINQYDMQKKYLKTFDSVKQAADFVDGSSSYLTKILKNTNNKPYKGYIWEYA